MHDGIDDTTLRRIQIDDAFPHRNIQTKMAHLLVFELELHGAGERFDAWRIEAARQ